MRTFLVFICSIALAFAASGAQEKKKEEKPAPKKPAQTAQGAQQRGPKQGAPKAGGQHQQTNVSGAGVGKGKAKSQQQANVPAGQASGAGPQKTKEKKGAQPTTTAGQAGAGGAAAGKAKQGQANVARGKPKSIKPQHFNVPSKPNTAKAPPVKFQQNRRIEGSQNWQGHQYTVFRNYKSEWHDKNWWHNHHNRIVFVFGAPYFWNAGYWYPAWGYAPDAYYAWDGPIYASNNLPPDQVIANVQASLQQQGYYQGEVDGLLGPQTRGALAAYQRDHGLYETSAIDQPTLQSLGMA
jgi:peptidoglycan hydrolase-like protein with peptidoglycan-binding domain